MQCQCNVNAPGMVNEQVFGRTKGFGIGIKCNGGMPVCLHAPALLSLAAER